MMLTALTLSLIESDVIASSAFKGNFQQRMEELSKEGDISTLPLSSLVRIQNILRVAPSPDEFDRGDKIKNYFLQYDVDHEARQLISDRIPWDAINKEEEEQLITKLGEIILPETRDDIKRLRNQAHTYNFLLVFFISIIILLIGLSITFLLISMVQEASITAISDLGLVAIGGFILKSKNNIEDQIRRYTTENRIWSTTLTLIDEIDDPDMRDKIISKILLQSYVLN